MWGGEAASPATSLGGCCTRTQCSVNTQPAVRDAAIAFAIAPAGRAISSVTG